jgi:hypothetical protein
LKAAVWFRRGRLFMVSTVRGDYRRCRQKLHLSTCSNLRARLWPMAGLHNRLRRSSMP